MSQMFQVCVSKHLSHRLPSLVQKFNRTPRCHFRSFGDWTVLGFILQAPPQPFVSQDAIHRAFSEDVIHGGGMNGYHGGMSGINGLQQDSEDEFEEDVFKPRAALITDYRLEFQGSFHDFVFCQSAASFPGNQTLYLAPSQRKDLRY